MQEIFVLERSSSAIKEYKCVNIKLKPSSVHMSFSNTHSVQKYTQARHNQNPQAFAAATLTLT
jgi:hypothetical protein